MERKNGKEERDERRGVDRREAEDRGKEEGMEGVEVGKEIEKRRSSGCVCVCVCVVGGGGGGGGVRVDVKSTALKSHGVGPCNFLHVDSHLHDTPTC